MKLDAHLARLQDLDQLVREDAPPELVIDADARAPPPRARGSSCGALEEVGDLVERRVRQAHLLDGPADGAVLLLLGQAAPSRCSSCVRVFLYRLKSATSIAVRLGSPEKSSDSSSVMPSDRKSGSSSSLASASGARRSPSDAMNGFHLDLEERRAPSTRAEAGPCACPSRSGSGSAGETPSVRATSACCSPRSSRSSRNRRPMLALSRSAGHA